MFLGTRSGGRRSHRPSVVRKLALGAVVACAFAAFAAQGASAAPCTPPACVPLSFNHVLLDSGGNLANIVTPSTQPLTAQANITGSSGTGEANYAVAPSGVSFPTFSFTIDGFSGTIKTTLAKTATGTINFVSGAVTMAADFAADVHLDGVTGDCTLDTGNVNLSTANTQPLMGVAFPAGSSGAATGAGAFGGTWLSVSTSPSGAEACTLLAVGGLTGPGGLWISRNLTPPSPTVTHNKLKTVRAGKTEKLHVKLANAGQVGTGAIKLCLKAPRHFKVNKKCQTVANVAGGKTDVVTFKIKTPKKKPRRTKTYKLVLTPSTTTEGLMGDKVALAPQIIKFKVKR
jgi:hypothetical protein